MVDCGKCDREAVTYAAYSGSHRCERHFRESVERRVRRRVREDGLLSPSATPGDPDRWLVGLSGGKDSVVLTRILHETFERDPRVEIVALTVHEGIEGYRDRSLDACRELVADLGIEHEVVTYEEEFDVRMDRVVAEDPEEMAACAYCGVFRRDVLARHARRLDADLLLTGHNLDDEAQTALMNLLEGDLRGMAKHFDASLGPLEERPSVDRDGRTADAETETETDAETETETDARTEPEAETDGAVADGSADATANERGTTPTGAHATDGDGEGESDDGAGTAADGGPFVPRAKPLRDVPEKEVGLYAHLRDLPAHVVECPHASEAYRGEVRDLLLELEENHPGTRHSIVAGYEELAAMAAERYRGGDGDRETGECAECGAPTSRERCRKCSLLAAL